LLGRVGVITQGEYRDRLILFYAEPTPGYWTGVVSSSPEEGPLDFFIIADEYAANVIEEYGIVWLARSVEEAVVEEMVFDCRGTFKTPRRTINRWISDVLGRRSTEPRSSS
jgi:hypothetical protein